MDNNRIVTYSLLAHINNNSTGIKDFNDIFIPLVKRTLSKMCSNGISKGLLKDVKSEMDKLYSLDMPFPLLKKNLQKIAEVSNSSNENEFQVFRNDGSFILHKYMFVEYEEIITQQEADIEAAKLAYEKYLEANGFLVLSQPSIFDFLDKHRVSLSDFFANKKDTTLTSDYAIQANFINEIKGVKSLFEIIKRIYFGSIITSYLELDFGVDSNNKLEFLLDTTFIVSLIDLHSEESTHTCKKILEICKRLGYKIFILTDTIEETQGLIYRTADNLNKNSLAQRIDTNGIYNACERLSISKTDLERIAANLETTLTGFDIYIVHNTEKFRKIGRFSDEFDVLKNRKNNPDGALHDATAIAYVKEKRGKGVKSFYDAKCWFVTDMRCESKSYLSKTDGFLPETIRPDELVNILWLSNPNVKSNEVNEIGLTRLIANAINDSLPNPRVLKEFDENVQKYATNNIEPSDCVRVANAIANKTINNLEQLNKIANEDSDEFIIALKDLARKAKIDEGRKEKLTIQIIDKIHQEFENKFLERDLELKNKHHLELTELKSQLTDKNEIEVSEISAKVKEDIKKVNEKHLETLKRRQQDLSKLKEICEKRALYFSRIIIGIIAVGLIVLYAAFAYYVSEGEWEIIQKKPFYIASPLIIFGVGLLILSLVNREISFKPRKIKESIEKWKTKKNYRLLKFNNSDLEEAQLEINKIESQFSKVTFVNNAKLIDSFSESKVNQ